MSWVCHVTLSFIEFECSTHSNARHSNTCSPVIMKRALTALQHPIDDEAKDAFRAFFLVEKRQLIMLNALDQKRTLPSCRSFTMKLYGREKTTLQQGHDWLVKESKNISPSSTKVVYSNINSAVYTLICDEQVHCLPKEMVCVAPNRLVMVPDLVVVLQGPIKNARFSPFLCMIGPCSRWLEVFGGVSCLVWRGQVTRRVTFSLVLSFCIAQLLPHRFVVT